MFSRAIVCSPSPSMIKGLTTANLGLPDYSNAVYQHQEYIQALKDCGLDVTILDANDNYPDSTFIEDTAILTQVCAIITNPGAVSRKGEIEKIGDALNKFYSNVERINFPGTLEAGDVMMVGTHCYIGLSKRTNELGAQQLIEILNRHGLTGSTIKLEKVLHLKTGVAYLENNNMVACGEFISHHEFQKYNLLKIDEDESYAANCVWAHGNVLVPKGYPKAKKIIENAGYSTIEVDVSEFQKLDGGLSCLSLRF
jgi:dimethylargininase